MVKRLAVAMAAIMVAPPASAQRGNDAPETSFVYEERGWQLYVDHTTDDGCYIVKPSATMTFRVQHDPQSGRVYVIILSHRWQSLDQDKHYPLAFNFDRHPAWEVQARALLIGKAPGLSFWVDDKVFLEELMTSHFVTFRTGDKLVGSFDLSGSAKAIEMLATCKTEMEKSKDPFAEGGPGQIPPPIFIPAKPKAKPADDPFST